MSQEEDKSTKKSSKGKASPLIKPEPTPSSTFSPATPRIIKKASTRKFFGPFNKSSNKLELNWGMCRAIQNVFPFKEDQYPGTVRAMKWSKDGKFFAAAGQDKIVRVWMRAPIEEGLVLKREPFVELPGHTDEVLTLDWLSNGDLISGSMDKSVIIWPISKLVSTEQDPSQQSTLTYTLIKHKDDVTSVCAHPTDPHIFVTGSMDTYVRLWRTNGTLLRSASVGEFVSCVAISPDQSQVIAGTFEGSCLFYWVGPTDAPTGDPALKLVRKFSVTGIMSKIRILGFAFRRQAPEFLVTCSDSKLRLYDFGELKLVRTYKGFSIHKSHQFVASFSDNGTFITSGSDNGAVCLWKADPQKLQSFDELSVPCKGSLSSAVNPPVAAAASASASALSSSPSSVSPAAAAQDGGDSDNDDGGNENIFAQQNINSNNNGNKSGGLSESGSNKKIVVEESFNISDREVICSVFVQRQSGEEGIIKEGRFIIGGDKYGLITIFENPVLCEDDEYDDNVDSDSDKEEEDDDGKEEKGDDDDDNNKNGGEK